MTFRGLGASGAFPRGMVCESGAAASALPEPGSQAGETWLSATLPSTQGQLLHHRTAPGTPWAGPGPWATAQPSARAPVPPPHSCSAALRPVSGARPGCSPSPPGCGPSPGPLLLGRLCSLVCPPALFLWPLTWTGPGGQQGPWARVCRHCSACCDCPASAAQPLSSFFPRPPPASFSRPTCTSKTKQGRNLQQDSILFTLRRPLVPGWDSDGDGGSGAASASQLCLSGGCSAGPPPP